MSERHNEQQPEPERPYTADEWLALRDRCVKTAWAETNIRTTYEEVWRLTDAVLRAALPDRVPPEVF